MKTVKEFKSYPIEGISKTISNDVNERIEARYQRIVNREKLQHTNATPMLFSDYSRCRLDAHSYVVGELQSLLTIAVMELKHLETVNSQHAPIPSK